MDVKYIRDGGWRATEIEIQRQREADRETERDREDR